VHILLTHGLYAPQVYGGSERSLQHLAEALAALGRRVSVVVQGPPRLPEREAMNGVGVARIRQGFPWGLPSPQGLSFTRRFARRVLGPWRPDLTAAYLERIAALRPDIVNTNFGGDLGRLWAGVRALGIPVVHTLRTHKLLCLRGNMARDGGPCPRPCPACVAGCAAWREAGAQHLSGVIGISRYILEAHKAAGWAPGAPMQVIPNAVPAVLAPTPRPPPAVPLRLGYLGRLIPEKGAGRLLEAALGLGPRVTVAIAGQGPRDYVAHLTRRYARPDVWFAGFQDPGAFLAQVDVLAMPSLFPEPFGRGAIEAFAHGVPVLAARTGGLPEVVDESTGWLFDPYDPADLARCIADILDTGPDAWRARQGACLAAAQRYSPERVARATLDFYEAVLRGDI
jgi:glycosyltransferase involved in cell wall biosynthesis